MTTDSTRGATGGETVRQAQVTEVADGLRRLLNQIATGTMTAGSGTVARLEGALTALDQLAGQPGEPAP